MRKNNRPRKELSQSPAWHRLATAAMLLYGLVAAYPGHAQDPASNQATLNFVGADIESVIKAIGHYTNTTFLIDPRVKGTINLVSERPLTKAQAFQLLTSTLRMHGYTVVVTDGFTKVVPESDAKLQAGPIQGAKVRGDQIATQIFRLRHESAAGLVPVLRPLISPNNTINAYPGSNALVITDYADNLKRLGRIIAALDRPVDGDVEVVPVRHAIASDIAAMVGRLLAEPQQQPAARGTPVAGASDAGGVTLLADSRTNSIIVRSSSVARTNLARTLIEKLDVPTSQPGNVHVVPLKNAEAAKLAQTLRAVVAGESGAPAAAQQAPAQPAAQAASAGGPGSPGMQAPPSSPAPQQGPLPTGGPGGFIQADPATNTLIITANEAVYRNLRAVIDQLDSRRAQVYVESLIVEVSANRAAEFGIQWAGLTGSDTSRYRVGTLTGFSQGGNNLINLAIAAGNPSGGVPAPGNGLNLGIFRQVGGELTLGALARALETDDDANILSMPNLITLDNEEARIIVGQNVPFITGQFTTPGGGGTAGVNPFQTIERKDIGLSLRVRPQISEGGAVKMAIYQETSSIQDTTASGLITSKRSIETNVLVDDGQIIVLGGLIDDNTQDGVEKVPFLGDIPILGHLFKYQRRSRVKTNLMVFLRPTVIRNSEQSAQVTTDRYDYIRNASIHARPEWTATLPDMGAPELPPMQDGRIIEPPLLQWNQVPGAPVPADSPGQMLAPDRLEQQPPEPQPSGRSTIQ